MRTVTVLGALFLLCANPAHAQSEKSDIIKSCPVLTGAEAAAVLGAGTAFATGLETTSGTTRISLACEFVQGQRTLMVQATKTLGGRDAWEAIRALSNGTLEQGLGEYAYSDVDEGKPHVLVVKGALTLELRIGGKGATAADVAKLREAAKKVVPRL